MLRAGVNIESHVYETGGVDRCMVVTFSLIGRNKVDRRPKSVIIIITGGVWVLVVGWRYLLYREEEKH